MVGVIEDSESCCGLFADCSAIDHDNICASNIKMVVRNRPWSS